MNIIRNLTVLFWIVHRHYDCVTLCGARAMIHGCFRSRYASRHLEGIFTSSRVCVYGFCKSTSDVCLYIVCFTGNFILSSYTSNWYTSLLIFFLFKEFDRYHRAILPTNALLSVFSSLIDSGYIYNKRCFDCEMMSYLVILKFTVKWAET